MFGLEEEDAEVGIVLAPTVDVDIKTEVRFGKTNTSQTVEFQ